ncbi:E3 ubiquitin/ISG15 ligase TRIM25-like [Leptodactylus fuscus]|uniref:E3 ubiquitin/ISG15 ligase TRIM25-like n=1 Tax=Leptodactylus fuscus TaxID=238119 RepID=UPI003F4E6D0B
MALSDLSEELSCSICLSIYTNPVMLTCGHNFCEDCITKTWMGQRRSYSCPECRAEFAPRPVLQKNLKLCNIVEHYRSTYENPGEPKIFCTYCVSSRVLAVQTCLHCEASFCDLHLKNHSKSTNHTMIDAISSPEDRRCPVHHEVIKYICVQDSSLLCTSCTISWKHKDHKTELLHEASEKGKVQLKEMIKMLSSKANNSEKTFHCLEEDKSNLQKKSASLKERASSLFGAIRNELNDLENKVLEEITKQETCVSASYSEHIQKLEKHIHEIYKRKSHMEDVCKIPDPLTFLKQDAISADLEQVPPFNANGLNEELISVTLARALYKLSDLIPQVKTRYDFNLGDSTDMIFNANTANNYIALSYDLKKATDTDREKSLPHHPERFVTQQVLSTKRFTSGKHYWEIKTSDHGEWSAGVTYNSVRRKGDGSLIGDNPKSWCLNWSDEELTADHNEEYYYVHSSRASPDIGIYLDYDGGVVSFYEVSDSIQHLHTFSATFTEPLFAGFYLNEKAWIKIDK